jgi:hypothetical protein
MAFIPRLLATGRDHFFLLGPRGTGKTSWCAQRYPDALRIDLLNPAVLRPTHRDRRGPEALERKAGQQFILIGSSARSSFTGDWHESRAQSYRSV